MEQQAERITELEEEVARLRGGRPNVELCIKPSLPKKEKGPRKPRGQSFARRALAPTPVVYHCIDECSDCKRRLVGARMESVMDIYHRAKRTTSKDYTELERSRLKTFFESELLEVCRAYVKVKTAPERVLAERMTGFISELFSFVGNPEIPSENNAAERAVRPAVVARKISGGSRSAKGSKTCSILRTLFETWNLQGHNSIDACQQMIAAWPR